MKVSLSDERSALTLVEVLVVMVCIAILFALLLPRLAISNSGSSVAHCQSNLKQVGLGWLQWIHDNESGDFPFRTPMRQGGTMDSTDLDRNQPWWQFAFLSNELSSAAVLVCPADRNVGAPRKMAGSFSTERELAGLRSPGFRDLAVSYTIGLDPAIRVGASEERTSTQILGSDRNIRFEGRDASCSSRVGEAQFIRVKGANGQGPPGTAGWTNAIHGIRANVLLTDGSVDSTSTKEFNALCDLSDDNGRIHFLVPE